MENEKTYSSINLYNEGLSFIKLYQKSQECFTLNMRDEEVPGIFCLLTGLELILKSYLVLKDHRYCSCRELKKCGHNFEKISNKFKEVDNDLYNILLSTFKNGYFKSWENFFRYPENFSIVEIPQEWRLILDWSGETPVLNEPKPFVEIIDYINKKFKHE